MDIAKRSLEIKRKVCTKLLNENFYPYTKRYLGNFNSHFSTIGLVGMNEMCLNACWIKENIAGHKGLKFSQDVLDFMREKLKNYQETTGDLYNLEATPAESTAYRLAKMDRERWDDIITAATGKDEKPFYTNSCHLPVNYTTDPFEALEIQDKLQTKFTGGTVFHTFLGEKLPSWQSAAALVKKIAYTFKLPYFTISPTYTICPKCGYSAGEHDSCPKCGGKVEVYSRITGYYRPIEHWNDGKKQEFEKRTEYRISDKITEEVNIGNGGSEGGTNCERTFVNSTVAPESFVQPAASMSAAPCSDKQVYLFTQKTCPNCPKAKEEMEGTPYLRVLDAAENMDLARKFGIRSVPTVVVCENNAYKTYSGLSDIISFKKNLK
jgi:ribonucleoside-triphosphate reductase